MITISRRTLRRCLRPLLSACVNCLRFPLMVLATLLLLVPPVFAQSVSFAPATTFPASERAVDVAIGDFNGDGKPDVAAANFFDPALSVPPPGTVSVLLGTGTGALGSPTSFTAGVLPVRVVVGDLNGDGKQDLVVSNFGTNFVSPHTVSILLGDGAGAFGPATNLSLVGSNPRGVAIGDLNNDGRPDIAVVMAGSCSELVNVFFQDSTGSFVGPTLFSGAASGLVGCPIDLVVRDLNGDGNLDLIYTVVFTGNATDHVSVRLGDGTGSFGPPATFPVGAFPWSMAVADLNGDGKLDMAVVNTAVASCSVSILLGDGIGGFGAATNFSPGFCQPVDVAVGDFNGDGKPDLVVSKQGPSGDGVIAILLGDGNGSFGTPIHFPTGILEGQVSGGETFGEAVAVADFNMDGKPDVVVANSGTDNVSILLNTSVFAIQVAIDIKPGSFPNSINLGSGGTVPVAILSSATFDATTVDPTTVTLASAPVRLTGKGTPMASFQDVNGDGLSDVVVHVATEALQLSETDTEATLEGFTFSGTRIRGTDSVRVVP